MVSYVDHAEGVMEEDGQGGRFVHATLSPIVTVVQERDVALAASLHREAHEGCFVANSVAFPVTLAPIVVAAPPQD